MAGTGEIGRLAWMKAAGSGRGVSERFIVVMLLSGYKSNDSIVLHREMRHAAVEKIRLSANRQTKPSA
jgi:hypothetical protein